MVKPIIVHDINYGERFGLVISKDGILYTFLIHFNTKVNILVTSPTSNKKVLRGVHQPHLYTCINNPADTSGLTNMQI